MGMKMPDLSRPGVWQQLFPHALRLMDDLERQLDAPKWTFGGGTVLMLRIGHRQSKDIDLFVPDPQYLGYLTPRLSDVAEDITSDYEESAEYLKLYLPQGEIDIVVGSPLTAKAHDAVVHGSRVLRIETCAEIIAKKMWHRGDQGKARDLFDLCAVADAESSAIEAAGPYFKRHGAAFLRRLHERSDLARAEFEAIDSLAFRRSFDDCLAQAEALLAPWLAKPRKARPVARKR